MKKLYIFFIAAASLLFVSCKRQESFDHELLIGTWEMDTYMDVGSQSCCVGRMF